MPMPEYHLMRPWRREWSGLLRLISYSERVDRVAKRKVGLGDVWTPVDTCDVRRRWRQSQEFALCGTVIRAEM